MTNAPFTVFLHLINRWSREVTTSKQVNLSTAEKIQDNKNKYRLIEYKIYAILINKKIYFYKEK